MALRRRSFGAVVGAALVLCTCAQQEPAARAPAPAPIPAAQLDAGARAAEAPSLACTDFYAFACDEWRRDHPIPPDASSWSRYDEVTKKNRELVRAILEETARGGATPVEKQVGAYYGACMDEQGVESRGVKPLQADFASIASIVARPDLLRVMTTLSRRGIDSVVDVYAEQDPADATRVIAGADSKPFPLRVRDNYLSDSERAKALRAAYEKYLARIFALLGESTEASASDAKRVLELERALAAATRDEVARRNPKNLHNPVAVGRPAKGSFDWQAYLPLIGAKGVTTVNVHEPGYFDALVGLLATTDLATWRAYLRARVVRRRITVLPAAFVQADFDFFGRTLRGTKELAPRWKRCSDLVDRDIGEALGELFVARAFPDATKAKVRALVEAVREALRVGLATATWLDETTRRAALSKLAAVRVKVGHPDHFRDYSSIRVAKDDPYGNTERAGAFELARQLAKIGRPVDRDEWFELPQTLDAYGGNQLNEVAFTAGFLQPPVFDPTADEASMFGALGAVIGHELSHRFDDNGRNFDGDGNLRDWWTAEDAKKYASRAACFANQYSSYVAVGEHVDGKLTLGENIADNGGLRLAFRAAHLEGAPDLRGSKAAQRFFLAWGQLRCANVTDETERMRLHSDPHSPGRFRAIGAVVNMPEFLEAFECPSGSAMKNEPVCRLW